MRAGPERILVAGASARAAAAGLRRAGFAPVALDHYADEDTASIADCRRVDPGRYPQSLVEAAEAIAPSPWLYVGGLENHPAAVARISTRHTLLGNGPEVLGRVRDRAWLAARVGAVPGAATPAALTPAQPTPATGAWLWKPADRSGGSGVRASPPGELGGRREALVGGRLVGAIYLSSRAGGGSTRLCGVVDALAGADFLHAPAYRYCGGSAPAGLDAATERILETLGDHVGRAAGLVGAWNLDCVVERGRVWVLELNPRLTASVDLLADPFAGWHVDACRGAGVDRHARCEKRGVKAVYFAPRSLTYPGGLSLGRHGLAVADTPAPGATFGVGQPVLTMLGAGPGLAAVRAGAAELDRLFGHAGDHA